MFFMGNRFTDRFGLTRLYVRRAGMVSGGSTLRVTRIFRTQKSRTSMANHFTTTVRRKLGASALSFLLATAVLCVTDATCLASLISSEFELVESTVCDGETPSHGPECDLSGDSYQDGCANGASVSLNALFPNEMLDCLLPGEVLIQPRQVWPPSPNIEGPTKPPRSN